MVKFFGYVLAVTLIAPCKPWPLRLHGLEPQTCVNRGLPGVIQII